MAYDSRRIAFEQLHKQRVVAIWVIAILVISIRVVTNRMGSVDGGKHTVQYLHCKNFTQLTEELLATNFDLTMIWGLDSERLFRLSES